jgi:hypothetical protein
MASVPISVGTTATLIATFNSSGNETVWVHVDDTSPTVYFGQSSGVTTSTGVAAGGGSDLRFSRVFGSIGTPNQTLYGICAAAAGSVKVSNTTS